MTTETIHSLTSKYFHYEVGEHIEWIREIKEDLFQVKFASGKTIRIKSQNYTVSYTEYELGHDKA